MTITTATNSRRDRDTDRNLFKKRWGLTQTLRCHSCGLLSCPFSSRLLLVWCNFNGFQIRLLSRCFPASLSFLLLYSCPFILVVLFFFSVLKAFLYSSPPGEKCTLSLSLLAIITSCSTHCHLPASSSSLFSLHSAFNFCSFSSVLLLSHSLNVSHAARRSPFTDWVLSCFASCMNYLPSVGDAHSLSLSLFIASESCWERKTEKIFCSSLKLRDCNWPAHPVTSRIRE